MAQEEDKNSVLLIIYLTRWNAIEEIAVGG